MQGSILWVQLPPPDMGLSNYVSTYQSDFSGVRGQSRGRSRSFSAAPIHKPSTGRVPTSGRPMTRSSSSQVQSTHFSQEKNKENQGQRLVFLAFACKGQFAFSLPIASIVAPKLRIVFNYYQCTSVFLSPFRPENRHKSSYFLSFQ